MKDWVFKVKSFIRRGALFLTKRYTRFFPDRCYLSMMYFILLGRRLHWNDPQTYTEKLQWLKLYYHRPECSVMADKYLVKKWVADKIGSEYVVPTLGVWDHVDDIDFDTLPDRFVLKCNHDNHSVVICKDKSTFDVAASKEKLNRFLKRDFYMMTREWPYKNVPHRIIAEAYLDSGGEDLVDYKFFCFDGEPKLMYVVENRYTNCTFNYYDMDFRPSRFVSRYGKTSDVIMEKPALFSEMKRVASILSAGFPHVRVDLYCVREHIYFGEMTFFHYSGYDDMRSYEADRELGEWLTLPPKWVAE